MTRLRPFRSESHEPVAIDPDELLRERVRVARRNARWTELDPPLVQRGRYFVDAASDAYFKPHPGVVWARGSSSAIANVVPLAFVVERDAIAFFEQLPGTWSDYVAAIEGRKVANRTTRSERAALRTDA